MEQHHDGHRRVRAPGPPLELICPHDPEFYQRKKISAGRNRSSADSLGRGMPGKVSTTKSGDFKNILMMKSIFLCLNKM
jgi:hypothetical protein